jgi:hypothetical protein
MSHSTHVGFSPPNPRGLSPSNSFAERGEVRGVWNWWTALPTGTFSQALADPSFQSREVGVGHRFRKFRGERPAERSATAFVLLASGVGNNPDAVPSVRGTNGARRYAMPFRVMPDLGQVSENSAQPSTKQRCHVLHDRVARSYQANGSYEMPVESRTLPGQAGASPSKADVLAGESSGNDISLAFLKFSGLYIVVLRHVGPTFRQYASAERIDFAEGDRLEAARALKPEREAANAAEQIEDAKLLGRLRFVGDGGGRGRKTALSGHAASLSKSDGV